jgi:creatinine amidohydrolase
MSQSPPARLVEHVGHDVDQGALGGRVGVLPAGSVEYHGPHAPLGTDTFIARELAERLAARRPRLLVLPELAYMPCPAETRRHRGTIAISPTTATALLEQLFRSLFTAGLAGIVVVNAHIGNVAALTLAADAIDEEFPEAFVALVNWWETLPADETSALAGFTEGGHGHGGAVEMSVTQAIVPDLVRPELAEDVGPPAGPPGAVHLLATPDALLGPHGYHGRVSEIDRIHGARLLDLATDRIATSIDALLERVQPA